MWIEKLARGVLCVLTPLGPRYIEASFSQRLHLLWIFRHFHTLPPQVLKPRQQQFMDALCKKDRFVAAAFVDLPILGTLEARPALPPEALPSRATPAVTGVVNRLADGQQRS